MKHLFNKKFRNIVLLFAALFLLLFAFRLGYGYTLKIEEEPKEDVRFDSFQSDKKNYATNDYLKEKQGDSYDTGTPMTVDQKYEKIAEVKAESSNFESDEKNLRDQVELSNGIIQYERKYGNKGKRQLQLQVGVPPENFESLYEKLVTIGITHSKEIIINDKTNDYLELNASKASIEKTLNSLVKFKEKSGQISEFINLENRILEIEQQLQNLGVNLGDFDKSNEFCTIKFSLSETKVAQKITISFYHRAKVALEWTITMFLRIVSSVFFVVLAAFLIVWLSENLGSTIKKWKNYFNQKK